MRQLKTGEHFGFNKKSIHLGGVVMTHAIQNNSNHVPWHHHENPYFYLHLSGYLKEENKKKHFDCQPGTLLYHHSEEPHRNSDFSEQAEFFHIELEQSWLNKYGINNHQVEGDFELQHPALKFNFAKLFDEFKCHDHFTQLAVDGILLESFSKLMRETNQSPHHAEPKWVKNLRTLLSSDDYTNYSVNSLANELGLHPVYLSREFPAYFNVRLGDFIRNTKLNKSLNLLTSTNKKNAEIAALCGFSDESHFIRLFKKKYHTTPHQFRKNK